MQLTPLKSSVYQIAPPQMQRALRLSGVVPVGDAVYDLWNLPPKTDTVILIGGRGGMKTYGVSDYIAHQAAVNKKRCVILRDEKSLIKDSILNEILIRYDSIPFNTNTERLQTGLRDKDSGEDVVFTKGFRASENSKKANLKGISNIDIAVIEEMEDLTDEDKLKLIESEEKDDKEELEDMEEKNRNIQEVTKFLKQLRRHQEVLKKQQH